MRDLSLWGTAVLFLLASLYTVTVRREVYHEASRIGQLERELLERRRRNDNLALERERLLSPVSLLARAESAGVSPEASER